MTKLERAATLLGTAARLHPRSPDSLADVPTITGVMFLSGGDTPAIEHVAATARQQIGAQAFESAYAAGAAADADDLIRN